MDSTDLGSPSPQLQVVIPSEKLRRKRERERKRQEAAHFEKDLRSGDYVLFLQEVPNIKASHCRAWNCMPERRTGEPIIRSYYRFALKDVSGLHNNHIRYYHITCVERFFPDLSTFIRDGHFKMDGWIAAPPDSKVSIEASTDAIQDWFHYEGRTFDADCYERFKRAHRLWKEDWSVRWIEHQLGHQEQLHSDCNYCQSLPEPAEPKKADFFPDEPSTISLSALLARVSGQPHIDKWWCWSRNDKRTT